MSDKKAKHSKTTKSRAATSMSKSMYTIPPAPAAPQEEPELFQPLAPVVVAPAAQVSFASSPEFSRIDVPTQNLKISNELKDIETIQKYIDAATKFIPFLYSYRSISKAINNENINPDQQIIKMSMSQKLETDQVYEIFSRIFEGPFKQICNLYDFSKDAVKMITRTLSEMKYEPSDVFFDHLTQFFDVIFNIDNLKLVKTGIVNDLTFFKRKLNADRSDVNKSKEANQESQEMFQTANLIQVWISSKNSILLEIRTGSSSLLNFYPKYLEYCYSSYNSPFLLPKQRSTLVIGIITALYASGTKAAGNIFENSITSKVLSIIEKNSIIPLYAENSFAPGYLLAEIEGFPSKGHNIATTPEILKSYESSYLIKNKMDTFRDMYRKSLQIATNISKNLPFKESDLLELLSNAAEMSNAITLQFAFKMVIRKQVEGNDVKNYDRGVRLNYSPEDLNALIELIGYVKTLTCTTILAEEKISEYITKHINKEIQNFVQNDLEKLLISCSDEPACVEILNGIRDVFGFWHGKDPSKNLAKKSKEFVEHKITDTNAMLSNHLIEVLSVQIQSLVKGKSPFLAKSKKFNSKPRIHGKDVNIYNNFAKECSKYISLINYCAVLRESTNLGALWYREVFLDLDQIIQFPVRSSLPFILAEHLLKITDLPALHDSMMFPFEIYNDAAYMAINTFQSQYLYREIEAEVSLCIDMISFSFSETFYKFSRETAAAIELPYDCLDKIVPTPMRYNIIVLQNKLMLLGSQVDFNEVTTGKLNRKLRTELESYVELLSDIRLTPFVSHLVRVAKSTHNVLVDNHLQMEPYNMIWQRAISFTQPLSLESHLVAILTKALDFVHYKFNSVTRRFNVSKEITLTPPTNEKWASVYKQIHQIDTTYIGKPHFKAIVELLSQGEMSCFIQKITLILEEELLKFIEFYAKVAPNLRMLPPINKDELLGYFTFNSDAYQSFTHPALGGLLNSMRSIGNIIAFVWCLDTEIAIHHDKEHTLMTPILEMVKQLLLDNHKLFIQEPEIDLESNSTHRSFPALWTILEFLMCSPKPIKIGDTTLQPFVTFGDGPILCAHMFIELCNQEPYALFDSINFRSLELKVAEKSSIAQTELKEYIRLAEFAQQATTFARFLATPYRIERKIDA
ncbi:hypothetical protein TRFO_18257 [Tritrichomonas foetus]|uniref:CYRIA/CYRIB Rac1 binding domain-containing protein n=1 Tax=Tritrichomonas foetus TaxID=1144522 RepID=A0A1J4KRG8_9EUKA|nr:hypothetical protein TRFO_18257 [Tritrichomonas foetus]|eukprot:OHT12061.1 hypothetical protein TRFO_18257 [Tritrichomonas foetus]